MTERERLIILIGRCSCQYSPPCTGECGDCHNIEMFDRQIENLADHLLRNGVIVPPVKIGQTVYPLYADQRFRAFVERIEQTTNGIYFDWVQYDVGVDCAECWDDERFDIDDIGKTVFLDETEYLIALKERSEGE